MKNFSHNKTFVWRLRLVKSLRPGRIAGDSPESNSYELCSICLEFASSLNDRIIVTSDDINSGGKNRIKGKET